MTTNPLSTWRLLARDRRGVIALEAALMLPFILIMFVGLMEVTRFILISQKTEKTASSVSDIVAQATTMTAADLDLIFSAVPNMMNPYGFGAAGIVIVSSVTKSGTQDPKVQWQRAGGGTLSRTSLVGSVGGFATIPATLTLEDKDNIIVAEVYYQFTPLLNNYVLPSREIYKLSVFKPRLGALNTLN